MSFSIFLQRNEQEKNEINKTPLLLATYTGELKAETSIIDPVILIECDLADVANANYMTIPSFERSYFITNITSVRTGLVQFEAHCDVLSSFKNEILANEAVIKRQESEYNLYTTDKQMKYFQKPEVTVKQFPQGFNGYTVILAVAGGGDVIESTTWIIQAYENRTISDYTTVAGGTGCADFDFLMGSKYFQPSWTQDGVYYQNEKVGGENEEAQVYSYSRTYIECYRNNVGVIPIIGTSLSVFANSDPDDPTLMVEHSLAGYPDDTTKKTIDLPHPIKMVTFQWAEARA